MMNNKKIKANDIIAIAEQWTKSDPDNHVSAVILCDKSQKNYYVHFGGFANEIAKAVTVLMDEDPEIGIAIFGAVTCMGHKMLTPEIIQSVNANSAKIAELRRNGATDDEVQKIMLGK